MAKSKQKVDPDDKIIAEIKAYIRANPPPREYPTRVDPHRPSGLQIKKLYPVASKRRVAEAEAALGFEIPSLLKRFYLEVSNGIDANGWIIGVEGGCEGSSGTLVREYHELKAAYDYVGELDDWNPKLLPFCDWGCAICSCIDCSDPTFPISTWEDCELWPEDYTLRDFFKRWIKGKGRSDPEVEVVSKTIKNPFTGKKTTVYGQRRRRAK